MRSGTERKIRNERVKRKIGKHLKTNVMEDK
jgi:hypothetical protein